MKKEEKAKKRAQLAAAVSPAMLAAKRAAQEEKVRRRRKVRAEVKAKKFGNEGEWRRSPRTVRKEKKAEKLLAAAGLVGTGSNAAAVGNGTGLNRMARRIVGAPGPA